MVEDIICPMGCQTWRDRLGDERHDPDCLNATQADKDEYASRESGGSAMRDFADDVRAELARARAKHDPVNSLHEGYAVIYEELDEYWDEVRSQDPERWGRAYHELVQTAAMCMRTAEDVIAARYELVEPSSSKSGGSGGEAR